MTMPSSGQLLLSGTTSPVGPTGQVSPISAKWETYNDIGNISMDDYRVRIMAKVGGSGSSYGMGSYYGKSWVTPMATIDMYSPWTTNFYQPFGNTFLGGPYGYTAVAGYMDSASVNGGPIYDLPDAAWCPHTITVYNDNPIPQVVNVFHTSYMGMCGGASADVYRRSPQQVLLGSTYLPTVPDNSIIEYSGSFTDTIPAYTTHVYGIYYRATFFHGVDRNNYGEGFRRMIVSFNSWG